MSVHTNVRRLRRNAHLSQGELAAAIGVSVGTLSAWESGTAMPRLGHVAKLAKALGRKPSDLVGYERMRLGNVCVAQGPAATAPMGQAEGPARIPAHVLIAHPRAYAFSVDARSVHPLLPGRVTFVYDPYRMPAAGELAVVCVGPCLLELRRWGLPAPGIPLPDVALTGVRRASSLVSVHPYPLGVVCWYQPSPQE